MKRKLISALVGLLSLSAVAQDAIEVPSLKDNWSVGVEGGVTTPIKHSHFFGDMRGIFGAHIQRQVTPILGLGVEGTFGINTSSWWKQIHSNTVIDNSYVGPYATFDLCNIFGTHQCVMRKFSVNVLAGVGWGHKFINHSAGKDQNYLGTKAGLSFNYRFSPRVALTLKPYFAWDMNVGSSQSPVAYNANGATFNLSAGVDFRLGKGFNCVVIRDQSEIDQLNKQVNDLRDQLDNCSQNIVILQGEKEAIEAELKEVRNYNPDVVKEEVVSNNLNSVRYIFYKLGSTAITPEQQPNIEMIASYLKSNPQATLLIDGYSSPDGNREKNLLLAQARAESVKDALVKKYGIKPTRIKAQGKGIGDIFDQKTWNRVSVCTIEDN